MWNCTVKLSVLHTAQAFCYSHCAESTISSTDLIIRLSALRSAPRTWKTRTRVSSILRGELVAALMKEKTRTGWQKSPWRGLRDDAANPLKNRFRLPPKHAEWLCKRLTRNQLMLSKKVVFKFFFLLKKFPKSSSTRWMHRMEALRVQLSIL